MAYQAPYLTDADKKKQEEAGTSAAGSSPLPTSGVVDSMTGNAGATAPNAPVADPAKTPGTGFVNLQQYLDMNKTEGGRLAGDATKGVVKQVDAYSTKAKNTVNNLSDDFSAATGSKAAADVTSGIQKDASATYDAAKDFLGTTYTGPKAGDWTAGLAEKKDNLTNTLGAVDKAENLQTSLKDTYGKGSNYTAGFGALDQFLVSGSQSGQDKLAAVKGKAADVESVYNDAESALTESEKRAKARRRKARFSARRQSSLLRKMRRWIRTRSAPRPRPSATC
jgi:hypothetical protein